MLAEVGKELTPNQACPIHAKMQWVFKTGGCLYLWMAASSFSFLFCIVLDLESPAASPLAVKNLSMNDPLGPRARLDAGSAPAGCFLSTCLLSSVIGPRSTSIPFCCKKCSFGFYLCQFVSNCTPYSSQLHPYSSQNVLVGNIQRLFCI